MALFKMFVSLFLCSVSSSETALIFLGDGGDDDVRKTGLYFAINRITLKARVACHGHGSEVSSASIFKPLDQVRPCQGKNALSSSLHALLFPCQCTVLFCQCTPPPPSRRSFPRWLATRCKSPALTRLSSPPLLSAHVAATDNLRLRAQHCWRQLRCMCASVQRSPFPPGRHVCRACL